MSHLRRLAAGAALLVGAVALAKWLLRRRRKRWIDNALYPTLGTVSEDWLMNHRGGRIR